MADTVNKPKLQLRSGISFNGNSSDKTPSPATKLLINHGKPNFTIPRAATKGQQNGDTSPLSPQFKINNNNNNINNNNDNAFKNANGNGNDFVVRSTKFSGTFKPANIQLTEKQPHQNNANDNEAAKVVLRRARAPEPALQEGEDDTVPEFIRRQRRIQERLAKENILDFESRRSGYFTHVVISPTSPNRTSFVETMSSPAIVPALEIPPPKKEETEAVVDSVNTKSDEVYHAVPIAEVSHETPNTNGHAHVEEEDVAKAIEEVNKAVAGEEEEQPTEVAPVAVTNLSVDAEPTPVHVDKEDVKVEEPATVIACTLESQEVPNAKESHATEEVVHATIAVASMEQEDVKETIPIEVVAHIEEHKENGHAQHETPAVAVAKEEAEPAVNGNDEITISHTNGVVGPSIPDPDPSGALGVNYEPKTVVSFSKDLGSEINKYPDTVKVVKDGETTVVVDEDLKEMAKLKFDIKADGQDEVQVTPVLRTD